MNETTPCQKNGWGKKKWELLVLHTLQYLPVCIDRIQTNEGIPLQNFFFKAAGLNMGLFRIPRVAVFKRILVFLKGNAKAGFWNRPKICRRRRRLVYAALRLVGARLRRAPCYRLVGPALNQYTHTV